jgi:C4-dicarboxylate-specific signal transduction histidine kinase
VVAGLLPSPSWADARPDCLAKGGESPAVCNVLFLHVVPRATHALLALEPAFISVLTAETSGRVAIKSEYIDLSTFTGPQHFEHELVAYLGAKYRRTNLDLVAVTGSESLRFAVKYRRPLFDGVPITFISVLQSQVAGLTLGTDISGVWLTIPWKENVEAARRLQPDLQRIVVVTGAGPSDRLQADDARIQLAGQPLEVTYLENMPLDGVLERLRQLPPRSAVILGGFLRDSTGRRFAPTETTPLIAAASRAPVYGTSETQFGLGVVGGRLVSFELQGRRGAEVAAKMLRGERPPPLQADTLTSRFDARRLQRWNLDPRRLPQGSIVEYQRPSISGTYGPYIAAGVVVLVLQSWLIVLLLANRAERRRAQQTLAAELRFETLISDLLASLLTRSPSAAATGIQDALARIGDHLDVDRVALAEKDAENEAVQLVHVWVRPGIPGIPLSIGWSSFPWMAAELLAGRVVRISSRHPLPPHAHVDRECMATYETRSAFAVPLIVEDTVVGVLSCATVRREREWPDSLLERMQLLADVFASELARRRAEIAARQTEERFEQQRRELAHALRLNTLGELGASLAHEINQPLSAILLNARTLSGLITSGTPEGTAVHEILSDIVADARRAGDIIASLRALARKDEIVHSELDLDALIDEVMALVHQTFVRRGITVHRVHGPARALVKGDRIQLQQVFLNLFLNASEALDTNQYGQRELTISTSRPAPGLLEVAVRDNGAGAAGVDTERMFQRFVTTKPTGLGMGLAISRSITTLHGGRIYAKANTDQGLTVYVELPESIETAGAA